MGQGRLEYSFLYATEETDRVRVFVYVCEKPKGGF